MAFPGHDSEGGKYEVVPAWADFMDRGEYAEFRRLIDDWMSAHNREYREVDGGGLEIGLSDGQSGVLALMNLAQLVHQLPPGERHRLIADHFGAVLALPFASADRAFEDVRSMIKVRVYPEDYGLEGEPIVSRTLAPGVLAVLAIDYPTSVVVLTHEQVDKWGRPIDELFELGLANLIAQDLPDSSEVSDTPIRMLTGSSFFVATWVLLLDRLMQPVPEHGALVALPNRHLLLYAPIVDVTVVQAFGPLLSIAARQFEAGPGSISPSLYWWRNGTLTLLPATLIGRSIDFTPPDDFMAVLKTLRDGAV
jgi:hypothetical protein